MDKFSFTQCVAVLFSGKPDLDEVTQSLERWPFGGWAKEAEGQDGWALSGAGWVFDLPEGGFATVDVVNHPWPDDPAVAAASPAIGSAYSGGAFGPAATPGALARAGDQPWLWPEGATVASQHEAFVRIRFGFAIPKADSAEAAKPPPKRDPLYELGLLTEIAQPLLRKTGALAFFDPAGEALRSKEQIDAALKRKVGSGPPPLELWTNVRSIALLRDSDATWLGLDVVGLWQLGLPDVEAIFAEGKEDPESVERLLRNVAVHLAAGRPVAAGSTSDDGSGRRWEASHSFAVVAPRRPVVRWLPSGSPRPSEATLQKLAQISAGPGPTGPQTGSGPGTG
ncbi:MAG: DUF4261 domain-containing protein [Myxococcales bacterium]